MVYRLYAIRGCFIALCQTRFGLAPFPFRTGCQSFRPTPLRDRTQHPQSFCCVNSYITLRSRSRGCRREMNGPQSPSMLQEYRMNHYFKREGLWAGTKHENPPLIAIWCPPRSSVRNVQETLSEGILQHLKLCQISANRLGSSPCTNWLSAL